eukprot:Phypoly_transcript_15291.p1 GENE.Phypoly_transcript_15291~~Phypoly_transcript_15291.p1  ORF type:complete len:235 (+),score=27.60 Phypoly_transcript_15291:219-923(+)
MTYWHFLNCSALTFGPSFIIYKSSKLSEYRDYKTLSYAALAYIVTQLIKLIIAATFLPGSDSTSFDLLHELLKSVLGIVDVLGVSFILNSVQASFETKLLGVALGWGAAETFLLKIAPLWIGARGLEFDWKYTQEAIQANIDLLRYLGFVTAVWIYRRKTANMDAAVKEKALAYQKAAAFALVAYTVLPSVLSYLHLVLNTSTWNLLGVQLAASLVLYFYVSSTSKSWEQNVNV